MVRFPTCPIPEAYCRDVQLGSVEAGLGPYNLLTCTPHCTNLVLEDRKFLKKHTMFVLHCACTDKFSTPKLIHYKGLTSEQKD